MENEYTVIVGNIGTVHTCGNIRDARRVYMEYCKLSNSEGSRASGENVTITKNGEPVLEFYGSLSENEEY